MKNYEKYMEELIDSLGVNGVSCYFIHRRVFHEETCAGRNCIVCNEGFKKWLKEEYKPQIDWSKVPVDTPVIVKELCGTERKRHFCRYEKDHYEPFVCFNSGYTSFTGGTTTSWDNCELAREEDIEKYSI